MIYPNAKLVEFTTSDKLKLPGILFEPKKKTKKVLIYLHGNGSSSVFYSLERVCAQADSVNNIGVSYFAFNNRGAHLYHKINISGSSKKAKVLAGMAYELIKECIHDVDAAISFLEKLGYTEFYLVGFSTGANKICVYNYYKPNNKVSKYILVSGGDDSGSYYKMLGGKKFALLLKTAKQKIRQGKGLELVSQNLLDGVYSYQSIYDIMNPDGDYNNFPYNEYFKNLKLSKEKLFRHYSSIKKPTLVIYGDQDEYSYSPISKVMDVLTENTIAPDKFTFEVIKNADHGYTGKEDKLSKAITDWLKL